MPETIRPANPHRKHKTARTISALMMREMQTTYGRNPGGYIWAILEPVGAIAMLTLVLSIGLRIRTPSLGTNFPLFYATGFLPFSIALGLSSKIASAIRYSKPLLSYPGVKYTDALIARFILNTLTYLIVFYIIMVGIHLLFDVATIRDYDAIATALAMTAALGLGLGTLNCYLFSVSALYEATWRIVTRPLMLLSAVIFIFEEFPERYQPYMWWNPFVHPIGMMRRGFYPTYDAPYVSITYIATLSIVTTFLGLLLLNRYHRWILNR